MRSKAPEKNLEGRPVCSLHETKSQIFLTEHRDWNEISLRSRSSNAINIITFITIKDRTIQTEFREGKKLTINTKLKKKRVVTNNWLDPFSVSTIIGVSI